MKIASNFSITKLFSSHKIDIFYGSKIITLTVPSVRDLYEDRDWGIVYSLFTSNIVKLKKTLGIVKENITEQEIIELLMSDLGKYPQYRKFYNSINNVIGKFILKCEWDQSIKKFSIKEENDSVTITPDIWDYVIYLLKLSCGEKASEPISFENEEARKLYMAQKEAEEQIKRIKSDSKKNSDDGLMKILLSITYAFPSLTIDYLFNQTMAQIQWLQKYAAGSVSYNINAQAFAAGNIKKGKKIDFFIK